MSEKRRGLGRGLGALIPSGPGGVNQHRGEGAPGQPGAVGRSPEPVDVFFADRGADRAERADTAEPAVGPDDHRGPESLGERGPALVETREAHGASDAAGTADLDRSPGDFDPPGSAPDPADTTERRHDSRPDGMPEQAAGYPEAITGAYFQELPVTAIAPNPRQPRQVFDEEAMTELAASITEVGLLQPIVVRPLDPGRYELVMGERRWRAAQVAGLTVIPAIVRSTGDDAMLRDALLENLHRSQLNALEEAAAYDQLLQDFGCTHDELASRLGRSRPQISNTLRLLRLPPLVQRRVAAGVLSAGHARALLGLEDGAEQERLAQRIVAEGLSVRSVEEVVALGEASTAPPRARTSRPHAPGLEDLASRLSDRFDTRVKVDLGRRRGRITVDFASVADLQRIVELLAPGLSARAPVPLAAQSWQRATPGA